MSLKTGSAGSQDNSIINDSKIAAELTN